MKQCSITTLSKPITGFDNEPIIDRYILTVEALKKDLRKLKQKPSEFTFFPSKEEVDGQVVKFVKAIRNTHKKENTHE